MSKFLAFTANAIPLTTVRTELPAPVRQAISSERSVPQLISERALENPGQVALSDNSMQLTYGELEERASRLAHQLKESGVAADTVVAVCMRRSPLAALAAFAVMKAGAAYLPVDPNYPRERLAYILTDSRAPVVISDLTVAGKLPEGRWRLLLMDRADIAGKVPRTIEAAEISPDQLAYVIYTSGSTGTPKGVEITQANLSNFVAWYRKAFSVIPRDRATQFSSFGFDAAVAELWPHLAAGASVFFTPDEMRSSPELLRDWLISQEITIAFAPTALAERLITLDWPASARLRFLLTGADTLHRYPRPGLPFVLVNNYGPTETTIMATSGRVAAPTAGEAEQRPSIGRPIDGAQIYILDEWLRPVAHGEIGELCIGGAGVGRGYVNSPELTAKKFVPDPFVNRPGARLYRTGDRARRLPDGQIEYIGRIDYLIKIQGYRVEPNEIVGVLDRHPAILASAVVARQDGTENPRLVAYLVLKGEQRPVLSDLRELLRSRLPAYMIPAIFVVVPDLPMNSNGKLDRKALPAPVAANVLPDENYLAPRTLLEEKLSALVAHLLGVAQVGVTDNLFLIGGHSLFGTQLIAQVRDHFGIELPLRSVFESPTPALLALEIERLMASKIGAMSDDEIRRALNGQHSSRRQE
jgi:amino acid adenylation domain-containing protein